MFGWFKAKEETGYSILVARGKKYLELSDVAMARAKRNLSLSCHSEAARDTHASREYLHEALVIFKEAQKHLTNDEPEDDSVRKFLEFNPETYR